jgi:predicted AAA+ superfamily ATPase
MNKIEGFIDQPEIVKVITGLRRSGKSVMLELIRRELLNRSVPQDQLISLNFEDMNLWDLRDPRKLHDHILSKIRTVGGRAYLFLDEVQEVHKWEACVNSLRVNSDADIYVTGSNAKMLTGELATLLAGRYVEIRMFPFSFKEFCLAFRDRTPGISDSQLFRRYLEQGGMPFLASLGLSETDSRQYMRDIFSSIVIKDVMRRNNFRDVDLLERIVAYLLANVGKSLSASGISRYFKNERRKVAPETVLNYMKACEEAYLIHRVRRLDVSGKKMLKVDEKYYVADHGLRQAVYGHNERDIGLVLENIVCLEMSRRGYEITVGRVLDREIDFVCAHQGERVYVQVCYLLASEETIEREFGVYYEVPDNFPKYVVSMDEFDMSRDGIRHMNIRDFLLASSY